LGHLGGGIEIIFHLHHRIIGIHHPEIDHCIDLHGYVISGNHILRRYVHGHQPQADLHHPVHHGDKNDQPRPLGLDNSTQTENDPPLVFLENPNGTGQKKDHQYKNENNEVEHTIFLSRQR